MECVLVSHTHWDREWYRTFEAFRGHLVDTIDRVLELLDDDPGFRFVLDGQAVVLEDYLAIRPGRRAALESACRAGRLGIGPWYVQPDSLLPSGESHVRNLLEGRRVAGALGPVSSVAYTPDSFGHPSQFPQLFAGFGLAPFVFWRGNGSELDEVGGTWTWVGPDGSRLPAYQLGKGYFVAAYLGEDVDVAVARLRRIVAELAARGEQRVLLLNGVDHAAPEPVTGAVAEGLAAATGWSVQRGLLDEFADGLDPGAGEHHGELTGARASNLLPGVWSSRLGLKLADRAAEAALVGWAEPWASLGHVLGLADERAALREAWRALLVNQAHDSIGGCSADAVHRQMWGRYATASGLADATTARLLEHLAGLATDRRLPWSDEVDVAVFNASPFPRSDVVRIPLDGVPTFLVRDDSADIHPLSMASVMREGFTVDGQPARVVVSDDVNRFRIMPEQDAWDIEVVVDDLPAFGWRRLHLAPAGPALDEVDHGLEIEAGDLAVAVSSEDGTLSVRIGGRQWTGLVGIEDVGDRGDTYDFDAVPDDEPVTQPARVDVERRRHASGIQELVVTRRFDLPARLADDRCSRADETAPVTLVTRARVAPGVARVDLDVRVDNAAHDHRLRLTFPTGAPTTEALAATTFDAIGRSNAPRDSTGWWHAAPATFPQQGWVWANDLTVVAPGLPEAEVTTDGTIAITLLRAVGWLARMDLACRPMPAGPGLPTPDAQCVGPLSARLSVLAGAPDPAAARAAELGLRAVVAGPAPLLAPECSLVRVHGDGIVLSALKPAEDGDGFVLRLLNPTDENVDARVELGFDVARASLVRLDETPAAGPLTVDGNVITLPVPPHALRSVLVQPVL